MTKLFEIQDSFEMGWCQAWVNDEDESKYFISLEGTDTLTKRQLAADDFDGYHCVTCNKCPDRYNCEAMDVTCYCVIQRDTNIIYGVGLSEKEAESDASWNVDVDGVNPKTLITAECTKDVYKSVKECGDANAVYYDGIVYTIAELEEEEKI